MDPGSSGHTQQRNGRQTCQRSRQVEGKLPTRTNDGAQISQIIKAQSIQSSRPLTKNGTWYGKLLRTMPNNSAESQASVIPRRASNSTKPSTRDTMLPSW